MLPLSLFIGFLIGASLGLLGGGGSILTVPALVYLIGQPPQVAVTTSLVIVGINSLLGALFHRTQGAVRWQVALIFGGVGMLVAYVAANLSRLFAPSLLMVSFAVLMLVVAVLMLRPQPAAKATSPTAEITFNTWKVIGGGALVGLLTGVLGVGGGFLIVPALVMLVGLPMHQAIGTSLVIIAMNSLAGFLGHLGEATLDISLILIFALAGLAGTFAGVWLGKRLKADLLRRGFALFVIGLALILLWDNVPKLLQLLSTS